MPVEDEIRKSDQDFYCVSGAMHNYLEMGVFDMLNTCILGSAPVTSRVIILCDNLGSAPVTSRE